MKNESNELLAENLPATVAPIDAHCFDPAAYDWVPVLRRPRSDGWTPQRQRDFIAALADSGCVEHAARTVGMTVQSCYRLRRSHGAEAFAAAWTSALAQASLVLLDLAFDRAVNGSDEPVYDREGRRVGRRMRHNDRMMMFLLRAYMPDRFRLAHLSDRAANEPLPLPPPPVEEALLRLAPVAPAEPQLLMAPDALADALEIADVGLGKLPHWLRGRGDREEMFVRDEVVEDDLEERLAEALLPAARPADVVGPDAQRGRAKAKPWAKRPPLG